tara:strand:+ start:401 stop:745 length:345 start_codon:yes stop_codon:yes gene_type:complete
MPNNVTFIKEDEAQSYSDELNRPSRMSFREGGVTTTDQQDTQGMSTIVEQNPDETFSVMSNFGHGGSAKSDSAALKKAIAANKAAMGMGDLLGISTPKQIKKDTAKPRNFKGTF